MMLFDKLCSSALLSTSLKIGVVLHGGTSKNEMRREKFLRGRQGSDSAVYL